MRMGIAIVLVGWGGLVGCGGGAPPPAAAAAPAPVVDSGTDLERFFPLVDGHLWHYDTALGEGEQGRLVVRAERTSAEEGALATGGDVKRIRFTPEGVLLSDGLREGSFLLKRPLEVGASWRGEHGGISQVAEVGRRVTVPAGTFEGCVHVVERRGGDRPMQVDTIYCPDVGMVELEASAGDQVQGAVLRSYGPPVDLGPDGVEALPPEG